MGGTLQNMQNVSKNIKNDTFNHLDFKDTSLQQINALNMLLNQKLKFKIQVYTFEVKSNEQISIKFPTSVENDRVCGILLDSTNNQRLCASTIGIEIDGNEILPDEFNASFIARKDGVSFYDNIYICNERANNSDVKAWFKDGGFVVGTDAPYTVKLYLWCSKIVG